MVNSTARESLVLFQQLAFVLPDRFQHPTPGTTPTRTPRTGGLFPPLHLPINSVFISLESVVNGGAHAGGHGVGVRGVRVLVGVQLRTVVQVHGLHGARAVRVSVHGGRDAHTVHPVVGEVFVLQDTESAS